MKQFLFLISSILITSYAFAQPAFVTDSLDNYIQREMQRWDIPGMAVAIVKDGKVIVSKGFGVQNLDTKTPVNENTLFQIASNSKAFTGTAMAILQEQGDIQLDDKVTEYLDYFKMINPNITKMVTIEDVLSHRLGYETFEGDFLHWNSNLTRKQMVESMARQEMVYDFRDTYGYCNVGFVTAGEILFNVTDTTWDNFIQHRFFDPLEMKRSSTTLDDLLKDKNKCTPYTLVDNALVKLDYANVDNLGPAASINSSVNDLSHWVMMQLNKGKYNNKQVVPYNALMNTYKSRTIVRDVYSRLYPDMHFNTYGLGWNINDYKGRRVFSHDGGSNGFVTSVCFIPEENLGIIVLTNTDANSLYDALRMQIIESYFSMPYRNISEIYYSYTEPGDKETWTEIHAWQAIAAEHNSPASPIEDYVGTYTNTLYGDIFIKYNGKNLEISFPHHQFMTAKLEPMGENVFLCTYSDPTYGIRKVSFEQEKNIISKFTLTVNDFVDLQPYDFYRKE
ncbi:MAG: serine hydrolase [Bacteroidetes bacterium]|nr:serine hydrolase [Bacteroidota bacterium]